MTEEMYNDLCAKSADLGEKVRMLMNREHAEEPAQKESHPEADNEILDTKIFRILVKFGMPTHLLGFNYNAYAIKLLVHNPGMIKYVTNELYPAVAEKFDSTVTRVERAIRNAIGTAWDRADLDMVNDIFGSSVSASKGFPTNSEFMSMIAERIRNGTL